MRYFRRFFMILLLAISASSVFAATSYEGKVPPESPDNVFSVNFNVNLSKLSLSEVGFASAAINSIADEVKGITDISINKEITDGNGTFESDEIYVYWKFLGVNANFPELWLKQEGVLNNGNYREIGVDWAVDIKSNDSSAQFEEALNSTNLKPDGVKIFPIIELAAVAGNNALAHNTNSYAMKLRTIDPYWTFPNMVYTSELWLIVKPN